MVTEAQRKDMFRAGLVLLVIVGAFDAFMRYEQYVFAQNVAAAVAQGQPAAIMPDLPSFESLWAIVFGLLGFSPLAQGYKGVQSFRAQRTEPAA